MPNLSISEGVLKITTIVTLVVITVFSWQTTARLFAQNHDELALTAERVVSRVALSFQVARLSRQPKTDKLPVPVYGVTTSEIRDSWGTARAEGRTHSGVDIFADRNTPVFSATRGYVTELNIGDRGGKNVMVVGPGGVYYYYAHLTEIGSDISPGKSVTKDTVLGFVGNSGNASSTPTHLHFGVYPKMWEAVNPYPKLVDRWSS